MSAEDFAGLQAENTGPSQQEAQALVERLRLAPAEEILTEVLSTLLSTAQVKLGRHDARLFIDLCAVLLDNAEGSVSDDLRAQVEAALGQLRMGQVAAEREVAVAAESDTGDLSQPSPRRTPAQRPPQPGSAGSAGSPSGLWIPGR